MAGAGDVNGDGAPDLLIGAPNASYSGRSGSGAAYVVFAKPDLTSIDLGTLGSNGYVVGGAAAFDETGVVANAGDVNGDGVPDAIVGAPGSFGGGAAYVVFGKATTAAIDLASLGTNGFRISGGDGRVGGAVAGAGDVNGDGKADVVIGAPDATKPGGCCLNYGAAFVVFGKTNTSAVDLTSLGSGGYRIDGASFGDHAGSAVSSAGDVNGDGMDDVLVSRRTRRIRRHRARSLARSMSPSARRTARRSISPPSAREATRLTGRLSRRSPATRSPMPATSTETVRPTSSSGTSSSTRRTSSSGNPAPCRPSTSPRWARRDTRSTA